MIKYYNTLAEYEADLRSAYESQVSLIGADNAVKIDGRNVIVDIRSARSGSIMVLDGSHALHFVSPDTYSSRSFVSNYEIVGLVVIGVEHPSFRGEIAYIGKPEALAQCQVYQWRLTGYTLDGAQHNGGFSVRVESDSWAVAHEYTMSYSATSAGSLVEQLNSYFQANEPFKGQEWQAILNDDGTIDLLCKFFSYYQASGNKGLEGFALTANLLPDWFATTSMLRKNGQRSGEGTITNWTKALYYYRNDNGTSEYQGGRTKVQTSLKQTYPINLPTWLGKSDKNPGDFCADLRAAYGEGEEGWLAFMRTMLPVRPTEYAALGDIAKYGDGRKNTAYLASQYYTDYNGQKQPYSPAAHYCANYGCAHEALAKGAWYEPEMDKVFDIVAELKYGTDPSRDADIINRALKAIGWPALSNGAYVWSSSRYGSRNAWYAYGFCGIAYNGYLCTRCLAVPVGTLKVPQSAL